MELIEGIFMRRSVRKYTEEKVPAADIQEIVKAGMYAPSARNQQVWEFIVVTDEARLRGLAEVLETAPMAKSAAFAVLVCANPCREKAEGFWEQDCAASLENMMLAALDKGVGTVWVGIHPRPERIKAVRKLFGIPEDIRPHSLMLAGYPVDPLPEADRFHPGYIHLNEWEG